MRTYKYKYNGKTRTYTVYTNADKKMYRRYRKEYFNAANKLKERGYTLTEVGSKVYSLQEFMTNYIGARNDYRKSVKKLPAGKKKPKPNLPKKVLQSQISFSSPAMARSIIEYYGIDEVAEMYKTKNRILLTYKIMHDPSSSTNFREDLKNNYDKLMENSGLFDKVGNKWIMKDGVNPEKAKRARDNIYTTINEIATEGSR